MFSELLQAPNKDYELPCQQEANGDIWFGTLEDVVKAKIKCLDCPLMEDCRDYARAEGIPYGVYGGESARSRGRWWSANGGRPGNFQEALGVVIPKRQVINDCSEHGVHDGFYRHANGSLYSYCISCKRAQTKKSDENRRSKEAA